MEPIPPKMPKTKLSAESAPQKRPVVTFRLVLLVAVLLAGGVAFYVIYSLQRGQDSLAAWTSGLMTPNVRITQILSGAIGKMHQTADLVVLKTDVLAEVEKSSEKEFWGVSLGTTVARVRVPARVQWVVDLREMNDESVRYDEEKNVLHVLAPEPELDSEMVDVRFEELEVQTEVGWARSDRRSGKAMREEAKQEIRRAAMRMGEHEALRLAARQMTAERLKEILSPIMEQMDPTVRVEIDYAPGKGILPAQPEMPAGQAE